MAKQATPVRRNPELIRGLNTLSRSAALKKSGRWRFLKKAGTKTAAAPKAADLSLAPVDLTSKTKPARFYELDSAPKPLKRRFTPKTAKLRASITPGTVLILLSGRFRGKRVVFLKQLESGLLLVTGPYKVNGVPLRRVNQTYVIATSTKVDVSGVDASKYDDAFFKRAETSAKKGEEGFFAADAATTGPSDARKAAQKSVDAALLAVVNKTPMLKAYLNAKFSLKKGDKPHAMKF